MPRGRKQANPQSVDDGESVRESIQWTEFADDPLSLISRVTTKLNSIWMQTTYPFAAFGKKVSIHHSCELPRSISGHVSLGNNIYLAPGRLDQRVGWWGEFRP